MVSDHDHLARFLGFFFVSLAPAGVIWEEGTSTEKMPLSDWPGSKSGGVFLING